MRINTYLILFLIITFTLISSKKTKYKTEIEINSENEDKKEKEKESNENNKDKSSDSESEEEEPEKDPEKEKEDRKPIRDSQDIKKLSPEDKYIIIEAPYQDNEDYIITPVGFGTPINFIPLQIETTSYKSWIVSSSLKSKSSLAFSYDKKSSSTSEDSGEWDTVVDQAGTISGNIIYDNIRLDKFVIEHFMFIEALEFEKFEDYKFGKLGLGNCQYVEKTDKNKNFCLLERLKENGSIDRKIFSLRELSDTHGELVIGDVTSVSKENDYPLLSLIDEDGYDDIEDDEFKMSWITKMSHVLIHNSDDDVKKIFENNIKVDGFVSFDSSCHYIEAPYFYINNFQEKIFDKYFNNICRKVNDRGVYMFLCEKEKFENVKENIKNLNLVFIMDGNGFEISLEFLFEQTRENDYEFFVHFKDFEQNIWNLGHPFFHFYTIIFDQDNQEIGIDGKNIYFLKDETENAIKKENQSFPWMILFLIILGFVGLAFIYYLLRNHGIDLRIKRGIDPKLVDNESFGDDSLFSTNNNQPH